MVCVNRWVWCGIGVEQVRHRCGRCVGQNEKERGRTTRRGGRLETDALPHVQHEQHGPALICSIAFSSSACYTHTHTMCHHTHSHRAASQRSRRPISSTHQSSPLQHVRMELGELPEADLPLGEPHHACEERCRHMKVQWSERGNEWEAEGGTRRVCVSTGSERKQMSERAWDQARRRRSRGAHASSGGMKKGRATGVRVHVLGEGVWLGSARRKHRWEPRTVCRVAAPWVLLHHQPALQLLLEHRPGLLPVQRRGRGQAPPHGSKKKDELFDRNRF